MTTPLIAPCGLDCAQCDAFKLTQANDQAGLEALAVRWQVEYSAPNLTVAGVTCDGCLATTGRLGAHCAECNIRACAVEHSFTTCAECDQFACEKLQGFFQMAPMAKGNLESLRK